MVDLGDFNPLDERLRWSIFCNADCWPEPENQRHDTNCPISTGIYTVSARDEDPWIKDTYGACCTCGEPFHLGDTYALVDVDTGKPAVRPLAGEATCMGCAALAHVAS